MAEANTFDQENPWDNDEENPYGNDWLDQFMDKDGTLMSGVWEGIKEDDRNARTRTNDVLESAWDTYIDSTKERTDASRKKREEYNKRAGERDTESLKDYEDWKRENDQLGEDYNKKVSDWSGEVSKVTDAGLEKARGLQNKALDKMSGVEAEYKDFTKAAISGQKAGTMSNFQDKKQSRLDAMRRSGAPQSALDQASYAMDRDMDEQLQTQISSSMGEYAKELSQIGMASAQMTMSAAGQEMQFTGMESQAASYGVEGKIKGLDFKTKNEMASAKGLKDLKFGLSQQEGLREKEDMMMADREAQLELQGQTAYLEILRSTPQVSIAEKYAMMLNYRSMPNSNFLFDAKMENEPDAREQERATKLASLRRKYPGSSHMSDDELLKLERSGAHFG